MNFETSNVIFILLFVFPGAFSQILNNRFSPKRSRIHKTNIVEFSEILASSTVIMAISFFVIYLYDGTVINSVYTFTALMEKNNFLIKYIVLNIFITCVFTFCFHYLNKIVVTKCINWFNKKMNKPQESGNESIWEDVFEKFEYIDLRKNPPVLSIEKDGNVLSRGFLRKWPAPNTDCNEIVLVHCAEIEGYFEDDKNKPINEKVFYKTVIEYCFFDTGITIKFYDMTKYNQIISSSNSN